MFRSYTTIYNDCLRIEHYISEVIDFFTSVDMENTPPGVFSSNTLMFMSKNMLWPTAYISENAYIAFLEG